MLEVSDCANILVRKHVGTIEHPALELVAIPIGIDADVAYSCQPAKIVDECELGSSGKTV